MSFKVSARTVLQLGAELISSDAIAFYELIKNAFDAGSPRVDIDVVVRIDHEAYCEHLRQIRLERKRRPHHMTEEEVIEDRKNAILEDIDPSSPDSEALRGSILEAGEWDDLENALKEANYIKVDDTGSGMSLEELEHVFLTIGTRARLKEKEAQRHRPRRKGAGDPKSRVILGEKGIGRLSAMRLGSHLTVITSKKGERNWNVLEIDWDQFSNESDNMIEDIKISPERGDKKEDRNDRGTLLWICGLRLGWPEEKLRAIATEEFSRLTDPFTRRSRYPIRLSFNNEKILIPALDRILFEAAHAKVEAEYIVEDDEPRLFGKIDYTYRGREKVFSLEYSPDLHAITKGASQSVLKSLGHFKTRLYWFNRQLLRAMEGIGDRKRVLKLQSNWAGGLMVFRDGFRVNPYGDPGDDWLDLDRRALASSGYKVNRRQIIGKVDISFIDNPTLIDQTNREGLRDCEEKEALVLMLNHILEGQFRPFLNMVDAEVQARSPLAFEDLEERVENEERRMRRSIEMLRSRYPKVAKDKEIFSPIEDSVKRIHSLMDEAQSLADSYEKGHTELLHLAGLGLMVEILAHELNRATIHTLETLSGSDQQPLSEEMESRFDTLEAQLKTLQKRLRILDPLSTAGRQKKESFDLIGWVREILMSHKAQFRRHNIKCNISIEPSPSIKEFKIKLVKGMIVQIMENLLSNSVYWLKQEKELKRDLRPEINIVINTKAREIRLTDNGPGVPPKRKEEIFQPFITTKPPGEGKGLGLYISREIAKYNKASIFMSDEESIHDDRLNTFVLSLMGENVK